MKNAVTIAGIARAMQAVLVEQAEESGRRTGFTKRRSKLSAALFVQSLVWGWLANEAASLGELAQSVCNIGARITRQALHKRFVAAGVALMEEVLAASIATVIRGTTDPTPLLAPFNGVYVMDSTVVTLPEALQATWEGVQGSGMKLSVCWDLQSGELPLVHLHDAREHDQRAPKPWEDMEAGALWLADLGYYDLEMFKQLNERNIYWLSRLKVGTVIYDERGQRLSLPAVLKQLKNTAAKSINIRLGKDHQIPCRLVIQRVDDQTQARREHQLLQTERKKQILASEERWLWCGFNVYVTTVPDDMLTPAEVLEVARVRWQIELLFKLWKNDLHIDEWRTSNPHRILCELYAKLIAAIIQHWLFLMGDVHHLDKSFFLARSTVRRFSWSIAMVLYDLVALCDILDHVCSLLQNCRTSSSASRPSTFKRLTA